MTEKAFDKDTTLADILKANPALIEILDQWGVHLLSSTVTAMISPLHKSAEWNAITDLEGLLTELNAKRTLAVPNNSSNQLNSTSGKK